MSKKRTIFEEVDASARPPAPSAPGGIDRAARTGARGAIRVWLVILFALVVAMIAVGGLTRLTDSGLSITEWRPLTGAIPPLGAADWQSEFDKYQAIDEFRIQNAWMTLADFKSIYWWEWGHRQLGRVIGLVWAIGFFWFLLRRQIPAGWTLWLILPGALGGMQGGIGWWMVASGVTSGEGVTDVASYRLAVHLGLAFVILGVLGWQILHMGRSGRDLMQARRLREPGRAVLAGVLAAAVLVQVLIGALVAGIDAGRSYTDWPLMGGGWLPPDPMMFEPAWRNFFENPGLVQFVHRCAGYATALLGLAVWWSARRSAHARTRGAFQAMIAVMALQIALGIVTVVQAAPWSLAIAHQLVAVLLWSLILRARFTALYPVAETIRGTAK